MKPAINTMEDFFIKYVTTLSESGEMYFKPSIYKNSFYVEQKGVFNVFFIMSERFVKKEIDECCDRVSFLSFFSQEEKEKIRDSKEHMKQKIWEVSKNALVGQDSTWSLKEYLKNDAFEHSVPTDYSFSYPSVLIAWNYYIRKKKCLCFSEYCNSKQIDFLYKKHEDEYRIISLQSNFISSDNFRDLVSFSLTKEEKSTSNCFFMLNTVMLKNNVDKLFRCFRIMAHYKHLNIDDKLQETYISIDIEPVIDAGYAVAETKKMFDLSRIIYNFLSEKNLLQDFEIISDAEEVLFRGVELRIKLFGEPLQNTEEPIVIREFDEQLTSLRTRLYNPESFSNRDINSLKDLARDVADYCKMIDSVASESIQAINDCVNLGVSLSCEEPKKQISSHSIKPISSSSTFLNKNSGNHKVKTSRTLGVKSVIIEHSNPQEESLKKGLEVKQQIQKQDQRHKELIGFIEESTKLNSALQKVKEDMKKLNLQQTREFASIKTYMDLSYKHIMKPDAQLLPLFSRLVNSSIHRATKLIKTREETNKFIEDYSKKSEEDKQSLLFATMQQAGLASKTNLSNSISATPDVALKKQLQEAINIIKDTSAWRKFVSWLSTLFLSKQEIAQQEKAKKNLLIIQTQIKKTSVETTPQSQNIPESYNSYDQTAGRLLESSMSGQTASRFSESSMSDLSDVPNSDLEDVSEADNLQANNQKEQEGQNKPYGFFEQISNGDSLQAIEQENSIP